MSLPQPLDSDALPYQLWHSSLRMIQGSSHTPSSHGSHFRELSRQILLCVPAVRVFLVTMQIFPCPNLPLQSHNSNCQTHGTPAWTRPHVFPRGAHSSPLIIQQGRGTPVLLLQSSLDEQQVSKQRGSNPAITPVSQPRQQPCRSGNPATLPCTLVACSWLQNCQ